MYGSVNKPRFWIDAITLGFALDKIKYADNASLFSLEPALRKQIDFPYTDADGVFFKDNRISFTDPRFVHAIDYVGVLNHIFGEELVDVKISAERLLSGYYDLGHQDGSNVNTDTYYSTNYIDNGALPFEPFNYTHYNNNSETYPSSGVYYNNGSTYGDETNSRVFPYMNGYYLNKINKTLFNDNLEIPLHPTMGNDAANVNTDSSLGWGVGSYDSLNFQLKQLDLLEYGTDTGGGLYDEILPLTGGGGVSQTIKSRVGSFVAGWTYDMPQSPNIDLQVSYDSPKMTSKTSLAGVELTNLENPRPSYSMTSYPFSYRNLTDFHTSSGPTGARKWSLTFRALAGEVLAPKYFNSTGKLKDTGGLDFAPSPTDYGFGWDNSATIESNPWTLKHMPSGNLYSEARYTRMGEANFDGILDNFYSKVIYGTLGGKLPFIFQPDKNEPEFSICKIDNDSITYEQIAPEVFDVSLTIREVW